MRKSVEIISVQFINIPDILPGFCVVIADRKPHAGTRNLNDGAVVEVIVLPRHVDCAGYRILSDIERRNDRSKSRHFQLGIPRLSAVLRIGVYQESAVIPGVEAQDSVIQFNDTALLDIHSGRLLAEHGF